MKVLAGSATHQLSSARLELSDRARLRTGLGIAAIALLFGATLAVAVHLYAGSHAPPLVELRSRNATLEAELARMRTELALERATRTSLDAQVVELNERIADLRSQLDFVNAQRARPRTAP
jgi:uncharacterized small protein (DUF1192 family)